jgi:hypothetical protein
MGFFSPVNLTNRYVGIWYNNVSATKPEWVPNGNNPIADSSGAVTISEDGNLVVLKGHIKRFFGHQMFQIESETPLHRF